MKICSYLQWGPILLCYSYIHIMFYSSIQICCISVVLFLEVHIVRFVIDLGFRIDTVPVQCYRWLITYIYLMKYLYMFKTVINSQLSVCFTHILCENCCYSFCHSTHLLISGVSVVGSNHQRKKENTPRKHNLHRDNSNLGFIEDVYQWL